MKKPLQELFAEFINECRYSGKMRPETLRGYEACFKLFIKIFPEARLDILTPEIMTEFFKRLQVRERMVGKTKLVTGIKNSTVATYRNKLNKFFTWLRTKNYLKKDPFLGVPYPDVSYSDKKYLKKEEVEKIFAALAFGIQWKSILIKRRNLAMFSVLLYCGLRKGELIGLKITDIDLDEMQLTVRAETSKSKKNRIVPLNSPVIMALKEYLEERRRGHFTTPQLWVSASGDIPFTKDGLKHLRVQVVGASGVKFHLHQFRHTFAANIVNGGTDVYRLRLLLGHSDIRMTAAYLRCLPTKSLQCDVERLDMDSLM